MINIKCDCGSSLIHIDAEQDLIWCKTCGHSENINDYYKAIPTEEVK